MFQPLSIIRKVKFNSIFSIYVFLITACGVVPQELPQLSKILSEEIDFGTAKAALVHDNMLLVNVTNSHIYNATPEEQQAAARKIGELAIEHSETSILTMTIGFYEKGHSVNMRAFNFAVKGKKLESLPETGT